ncbi:MAG: Fe-S protein assembly co-chaperone HscB [Gammaproteobacteria bacterium]
MLDFSNNYFELFGLPESYGIDQNALATQYRELQTRLHPDRYANATDHERRLAVQGAAYVNEAFDTLKDSHLRARYLLGLRGVEFNEEMDTTADPEFLMQQLELREALEEVRGQEDPLARLDELGDEAQQWHASLSGAFAEHYARERLDEAREVVLKMQFFRRLRQEIARLQESLEDELLD